MRQLLRTILRDYTTLIMLLLLAAVLSAATLGRQFPTGVEAGRQLAAAVASDLPPGAGLSSSAAIELASGLAMLAATGQNPPRETLVKVGRHAENNFVGVPCGILDQGVSGFGQANRLVFIDCRGPRFDTVPMPATAHFWIFNTHTKHALVDGLYAARHRECMEAARILGVPLLVDASLPMLDAARNKLPSIVEKRARHIIEEIARVESTVAALRAGDLDGPATDRPEQPRAILIDRAHHGLAADRGELEARRLGVPELGRQARAAVGDDRVGLGAPLALAILLGLGRRRGRLLGLGDLGLLRGRRLLAAAARKNRHRTENANNCRWMPGHTMFVRSDPT